MSGCIYYENGTVNNYSVFPHEVSIQATADRSDDKKGATGKNGRGETAESKSEQVLQKNVTFELNFKDEEIWMSWEWGRSHCVMSHGCIIDVSQANG